MDWITKMFGDNDFLSGGFLLGLMASLVVSIKLIGSFIYKRIKRKVVFTVTIEETDELFFYLEKWLYDHHEKDYRNVLASIGKGVDEYYDGPPRLEASSSEDNPGIEKESVIYRQHQDEIFVKYKGSYIRFDKGRDKLENASSLKSLYFDRFTISIFVFKSKINSLLEEVIEYNQQFKVTKKFIDIYTPHYSRWERRNGLKPKDISKIILKPDQKAALLADVDSFVKNKEWYTDRSIPYKRGYLFEGSPGNGKTSLALALAKYTNRDIYTIVLTEMGSDTEFRELLNLIKDNSILLFEDIDTVIKHRETKAKVNFSTLLNSLDGVYFKEGLITIMTTNHINVLDPALIRDGRIDFKLNIDNPGSTEVRSYVELFYDIKLNGQIYNKDFAMSKIQNICLKNSETEIIDKLFKL